MFEKIKNDIESCDSIRKRNSLAIKKNRDFIFQKMEEGFSASDIFREISSHLGYEPCHIKNFISLVKKYVVDKKNSKQKSVIELEKENSANIETKNADDSYLSGDYERWNVVLKRYPFIERQLIPAIKNGLDYKEVVELLNRGKKRALFDLISDYSAKSKFENRFIK